jgi:fibrillarin-like rRNA methylase
MRPSLSPYDATSIALKSGKCRKWDLNRSKLGSKKLAEAKEVNKSTIEVRIDFMTVTEKLTRNLNAVSPIFDSLFYTNQ